MNPMRKSALDNLVVMIDEISLLKEKLTEKEKQLEMAREENELLKKKKHQKKLRVQTETEQWRKAADAATAVLADRMEMNGRVTERCGSMDKHLNNGGLETAGGGYTGFDNLHYSLLQ
uniref:Uncharacterized protein n=1 Tax=Nelumbo nucifera TaxID=4432 RepID=A0A822YRH0_NELNU|nr:TPA_asm: hypothetical protein HUJ06_004801 [Nelumbo nucifera]